MKKFIPFGFQLTIWRKEEEEEEFQWKVLENIHSKI